MSTFIVIALFGGAFALRIWLSIHAMKELTPEQMKRLQRYALHRSY